MIGRDTTPAMATALRAVAEDWARNQDMRIVDEADLDTDTIGDRSLFLLGRGAWTQRAREAATTVFGSEPAELLDATAREDDSLIYVVRDPDDAERAWTVVLPEAPAVASELGRKLPHYSKYSWLRFDGVENVGKGNWTVVDSPLRREIPGGARR